LSAVADALPYLFGFIVGVATYRWCIGRVARSRDLTVTSRQLWIQTLVVAALPLAVALTLAWWFLE
jgi:hypothetical protein